MSGKQFLRFPDLQLLDPPEIIEFHGQCTTSGYFSQTGCRFLATDTTSPTEYCIMYVDGWYYTFDPSIKGLNASRASVLANFITVEDLLTTCMGRPMTFVLRQSSSIPEINSMPASWFDEKLVYFARRCRLPRIGGFALFGVLPQAPFVLLHTICAQSEVRRLSEVRILDWQPDPLLGGVPTRVRRSVYADADTTTAPKGGDRAIACFEFELHNVTLNAPIPLELLREPDPLSVCENDTMDTLSPPPRVLRENYIVTALEQPTVRALLAHSEETRAEPKSEFTQTMASFMYFIAGIALTALASAILRRYRVKILGHAL